MPIAPRTVKPSVDIYLCIRGKGFKGAELASQRTLFAWLYIHYHTKTRDHTSHTTHRPAKYDSDKEGGVGCQMQNNSDGPLPLHTNQPRCARRSMALPKIDERSSRVPCFQNAQTNQKKRPIKI